MHLRLGETRIHVDPGPGALVRALSHVPPLNPRELDGIVLSHKHLDHSGDVNALIEAMTSGGFRPRGTVLAPRDAFEGEPVVLPYAQRFPERVEILEANGGPYRVGDANVYASIRHRHSSETYGLLFEHDGLRVAYVPCGRFFEEMVEDYARRKPDVLIVNVLRYRDDSSVDHLKWDEAREIVAGVRPRVAIFQHFGTKMLEADPRRLAQDVEDELGLRAIAAYDDLYVELDTEVASVGA